MIVKSVILSDCSIVTFDGRRVTLCLSPLPRLISMEHSWKISGGNIVVNLFLSYLSIKGVSLQLVDTLELMSVTLCHNQTVLSTRKEFYPLQHLISTSSEVPLPLHVDVGAPLPLNTKPRRLLLVSVGVDHQRQPQSVDLLQREGIEVGL